MEAADTTSIAPTTLSPVNPRSGAAPLVQRATPPTLCSDGKSSRKSAISLSERVNLEPAKNIGCGGQSSQIVCYPDQPADPRSE